MCHICNTGDQIALCVIRLHFTVVVFAKHISLFLSNSMYLLVAAHASISNWPIHYDCWHTASHYSFSHYTLLNANRCVHWVCCVHWGANCAKDVLVLYLYVFYVYNNKKNMERCMQYTCFCHAMKCKEVKKKAH